MALVLESTELDRMGCARCRLKLGAALTPLPEERTELDRTGWPWRMDGMLDVGDSESLSLMIRLLSAAAARSTAAARRAEGGRRLSEDDRLRRMVGRGTLSNSLAPAVAPPGTLGGLLSDMLNLLKEMWSS